MFGLFGKKEKKNTASSFWYDEYDVDYSKNWDIINEVSMDESEAKWQTAKIMSLNLYKLASVRRAIANFVAIVSGKNIPVTYASKSDSYTDGKSVVLSTDVGDKFDVSVGLALHEGSHILLSNFDILKYMSNLKYGLQNHQGEHTSKLFNDDSSLEIEYTANLNAEVIEAKCMETKDSENYKSLMQFLEVFQTKFALDNLGKYVVRRFEENSDSITYDYSIDEVINLIKSLTNWIEDRRIDNFIYKSAPGYRDYYKAMYDHYFNSPIITKGLESDEYRTEDVESYMFRISNMTNPSTDLSALKELRRIYKTVNVSNISRLENSIQAFELACDIVMIVLEAIEKNRFDEMFEKNQTSPEACDNGDDSNSESTEESENSDGAGDDGDGNSNGKLQMSDDIENDEDENQSGSNNSISSKPTRSNPKPTPKSNPLSNTQVARLKKAIEKQKQFIDGNTKKKKLSKADTNQLKVVEESGSEMVHVGSGYEGYSGRITGVDCVVVNKITDALLENDVQFPYYYSENQYKEYVDKGISLGKRLGNKLQIRSESRETVYNRLNKGKIDQRLISNLGFNSENVFYTKDVDTFKNVSLHISLDYSGSMSGHKHCNTIVMTIAIAKACVMARNIDVTVSIRSTVSVNGRNGDMPHIAFVYNSKYDSFKRLCKLLGGIGTGNTTPEGLTFEAIANKLSATDNNLDSFFLNISDGEPFFSNGLFSYSGTAACAHTNKEIKKMKGRGIRILSYFVTSSNDYSRPWERFQQCYGADSKHIDSQNVTQIARTMNELFLKK